MPNKARVGDYVQIHSVVLKPGERAPQVPEETQKVPLEMRVKGFALHEAEVGSLIRVRTLTGREVEGTLEEVNPKFKHDFGAPVPELLTVGLELRKLLAEEGESDE